MIRIVDKNYIDSKNNSISIDTKISEKDILKNIIKEQLGLTDKDISKIIKQKQEIILPISIFKNKLSTLEIVVKYLKEKKNLNLTQISEILNRNHRTIWHAYNRSLKKKEELEIIDSRINIPISIFLNREFSPLESLVEYLLNQGLTLTEIAGKLSLNSNTVRTVNNRAKIKRRSNGAK